MRGKGEEVGGSTGGGGVGDILVKFIVLGLPMIPRQPHVRARMEKYVLST